MPLTTCPDCQREISTEARACPNCGKPTPRKKSWVWVLLIIPVVVALCFVAANFSPAQDPLSYSVTTADCICANDTDSAVSMLVSDIRGDAGYENALVLHSKAVPLVKGTTVYKVQEDRGVVLVSVKSGAQSQRRCYLLAKYLK